ncbi:uncharacterized protein LOC110095378 [Dendrobium catenatum]|uniref:RAB6A-GEF complex partner protein 2 n=1 Tax=Dendrobium catenatum TaxID=906689 RepID=A0A2I0XFU7_9ASPA|nr:uncharacterized protein LOC110095378 [Dendrobium catenatum]XP_028552878.1 uncharacterized protein LOC110095378 [Dendrobium catenatum]PKU86783.1 hypothetical protein MA16_Dca020945 [Dendrobium catenatum]
MSLKFPQGFSFFGGGGWFDDKKSNSSKKPDVSPSLKLQTDKEVYRPGDFITATIEISNPAISKDTNVAEPSTNEVCSLLVDNLAVEIKGVEKLDGQWFSIQKPLPGSKQKRGETIFLDCTAPATVSKVIVSCGRTKTYMIRVQLPMILPPSYRGTSIRYFYYVRTTISARWLVLENGHHDKWPGNDLIKLEARAPLQVWAMQKSNNFLNEEGALFSNAIQMDIYWKEKDADSDWVQANDFLDVYEEGYDSSRDEVSSVSSYTPARGNIDLAVKKSSSSQSISARFSSTEYQYAQGERSSHLSYIPLSKLSVAEVVDNSDESVVFPQKELDRSSSLYPYQKKLSRSFDSRDDMASTYAMRSAEPLSSEGFIRGRSYNIRIDDQVLLRFSPKNSDSTYYFGDMIGGTLTFFHGEGPRRCLEVSITLEMLEVINQQCVHPSRKNAPTITKVQNDHHEVVADLAQTSFIFSIPRDGPMSFSTPYISVQWSLRFEFFTTPMHVNLNRYEHPLLVEQREKGDWVLPITVCAPPLRAETLHTRNEKDFSVGSLFPS